jgi:hypothetical protein
VHIRLPDGRVAVAAHDEPIARQMRRAHQAAQDIRDAYARLGESWRQVGKWLDAEQAGGRRLGHADREDLARAMVADYDAARAAAALAAAVSGAPRLLP